MATDPVLIAEFTLAASVFTFLTSVITHFAVRHVKVLINSRMSQLLKETKDSSFAAGEKAERDSK
jgi:hypothetical protein